MSEIVIQKHYTSEIKQYVESISTSSEYDKLFTQVRNKSLDSGTPICFIVKRAEVINGILICKTSQIVKRSYLIISCFYAAEPSIYSELLSALFTFYDESEYDGILSECFTPTRPDKDIFIKNKFDIASNIYGAKASSLSSKLSKGSSIELIPFTQKNKREYSNVFTELLLKFDTKLYHDFNKAYGESVYKSSINSSRDQRIRISYFLDTLVKSQDWYSYLIIDTEESIIGFIKGKIIRSTGLINTEFYMLEKSFKRRSESSLQKFAQTISQVADSIIIETPSSDTSFNNALSRWFGKSVAHTYSHF